MRGGKKRVLNTLRRKFSPYFALYIIIIVLINCINFLSYYQIIYTYNFVCSMYKFFKETAYLYTFNTCNFSRMYTNLYIQCTQNFENMSIIIYIKCTYFSKNVNNNAQCTQLSTMHTIFKRMYTILYI